VAAARAGNVSGPGRPMVIALGQGGPAVSRAAGQQLARAELSKRMYHPGTPVDERIARAIEHAIDWILNSAGPGGPGISWWGVVGLAILAVLVAAAIVFWVGPLRRSAHRAAAVLLPGEQFSARDHRERAERMAAAGDFTAAIIESLRAIAAELEERSVLPPRPGRTADELAAEASGPLPGHAAGLRQAARLFDDIMYGGRDGNAEGYQRLRDLDTRIRAARPASLLGDAVPIDTVPTDTPAPLAGAAAGPLP
jgi:hypothetical protein